jgi:lipopolysaccharide transport system permease protein
MTPEIETWDREISPRRNLLDIPVRELWRYRDLVWLMAKRNITAQYKQTVLGPLWFVIQPLLTTVVFSFVFGRIGQADKNGQVIQAGVSNLPHFLFFMSGLVLFGYFSDLVNKAAVTFTRNSQLFGKVYFPRLAMPLSGALTSLAAFAVQFGVFMVGFAYYAVKMHWFPDPEHPIHLDPNWRMVMLPVLLLQITMLGTGAGLMIAALTTRYRDLQMGVGFMVQLWMFCSSVVIPLSSLPEKYQPYFKLNPMVPIIESFRFAFLGKGLVTQVDLVISFATCAVIFFGGLIMFSRTEQTVMDTV